jgi:hypothetical protein
MRLMFDSTNPFDIPAQADMVAGYVDGAFAWPAGGWERFAHVPCVRIATSSLTNDGHVLDVEAGDATPEQAVQWVRMRRASGAHPTIYCAFDSWSTVARAFTAAGEPEPEWWIADWDNVKAIATGAVAHQFANPDITAAHYDLSVVADHWPGVDEDQPMPRPVRQRENNAEG